MKKRFIIVSAVLFALHFSAGSSFAEENLKPKCLDGKGTDNVVPGKEDIAESDHWNRRNNPNRAEPETQGVFDPGAWGAKPDTKFGISGDGQAEEPPMETIKKNEVFDPGGWGVTDEKRHNVLERRKYRGTPRRGKVDKPCRNAPFGKKLPERSGKKLRKRR